ncbi:MAG: glycosyltransferase [Kiloniellales bacterium]|nr:glycosyltransferase [Kiloniellales bacterium]
MLTGASGAATAIETPEAESSPRPAGTAVGSSRRLAFFLHHLDGGGVSRMRLIIAGELARRGYKVDLLLCEAGGPLTERIPEGIRVIHLERSGRMAARLTALKADLAGFLSVAGYALAPQSNSSTLPYLPALVGYLRAEEPDVLYVATTFMAVEAALALRSSKAASRFVISEHVFLSPDHSVLGGWNRPYIRSLLYRTYSRADAVASVSKGVADQLARCSGFPRERITVVYNPTVTPALEREAGEALDHPWFADGDPPVILGAGRLSRTKDFATLVRAFALVRRNRPARLVILGNAKSEKKTKQRVAELMDLAGELGVAEDVSLPGFVVNPYKYMARASVYVLSSHVEGLPNALIEAMACGCPVVSTDTPSGPAEILEDQKYGPIVPIGDEAAMAAAILATLDSPPDPKVLRTRASEFSVDRTVDLYEALGVAPAPVPEVR